MMTKTGLVHRIGLLIPSSNTVVETEAAQLIPQDGTVTLHYSRFRVTVISSAPGSLSQFTPDTMLDAALLLADARVNRIAWAGTAASWLGHHRDEILVEEIQKRTGIKASTAVLAINSKLRHIGAKRIGLVTPYVADLENRIVQNYRASGIDVIASERLNLTVNTDYAAVQEAVIEEMVRSVAKSKPDAVVIMCTNLRFGKRSQLMTGDFSMPILDSVALTVEACL